MHGLSSVVSSAGHSVQFEKSSNNALSSSGNHDWRFRRVLKFKPCSGGDINATRCISFWHWHVGDFKKRASARANAPKNAWARGRFDSVCFSARHFKDRFSAPQFFDFLPYCFYHFVDVHKLDFLFRILLKFALLSRKRDLSKDIYIFKNSFQYAAQKARTARASETMPLP